MARLRVRVELNRGGVGVPLHKLASVVHEAQRFFEMLSEDIHISQEGGEWLGFDFDNESLNFTAEFVGPVSADQAHAFYAAFDGVTSLRRATIAQFTQITDALGEDELIGFGLYQSDQEVEPGEWRCLSRRDALRIADEIQLLLGVAGEMNRETHLPAIMDSDAGARLFKERPRLPAAPEQTRLPELVREVESNLSKRIARLEGDVENHSQSIRDLRESSAATEESFKGLLNAVENFCGQATRQLERLSPQPPELRPAIAAPAPVLETAREPVAGTASAAIAAEPKLVAVPAPVLETVSEPVASIASVPMASAPEPKSAAAAPESRSAVTAPEPRPVAAAPELKPAATPAPELKPATASAPELKPVLVAAPVVKPVSVPAEPKSVAAPAPEPKSITEAIPEESKPRRNWRTMGVAAAMGAVLIAGGAIWWTSGSGNEPPAAGVNQATPAASSSQPASSEPAQISKPAPDTDHPAVAAPSKPKHETPSPMPSPASPAAKTVPAATAPVPLKEVTAENQPAAPDGSGDADVMRVEMQAQEPVWVMVTDKYGKILIARTLQANETRSMDLTPGSILRTGNAGGLRVRLNGKDLGPLGPTGKIRDVEFKAGAYKVTTPDAG